MRGMGDLGFKSELPKEIIAPWHIIKFVSIPLFVNRLHSEPSCSMVLIVWVCLSQVWVCIHSSSPFCLLLVELLSADIVNIQEIGQWSLPSKASSTLQVLTYASRVGLMSHVLFCSAGIMFQNSQTFRQLCGQRTWVSIQRLTKRCNVNQSSDFLLNSRRLQRK